MSDNLDKQTIDWHSGFYSATCFVFRNEPYEFYKEYELNKKPIRIDVLIKAKAEAVPKAEVAKLFRRINVIEYKNPTDTLNYIQYYKTVSYACLYIGNIDLKDNLRPDDVTVSIFRDSCPKKLFQQLRELGCAVTEYKPGIYYVTGNVLFSTQIVVISQLDGDEYLAFKALSDKLNVSDVEKIIEMTSQITDSMEKEYMDSVLQVSVNVNRSLYAEVKEAKPFMCEALMDLFKDEIADKIKKATADKDAEIANKDTELANKDAENAALRAEIARLKAAKA